ncbi:hypothetical protein DFH08DRAFT_798344 [Mycena albidolilacea]|uniref:Uncharacterized protein n=1 Tax=Mycena albidolilacea TaxID=1033008 RepID=A0AAD7F3B9_9AGAR|nr:hypothetical protein DFH08DRAFT_798344 [Mycena albidolilacea]
MYTRPGALLYLFPGTRTARARSSQKRALTGQDVPLEHPGDARVGGRLAVDWARIGPRTLRERVCDEGVGGALRKRQAWVRSQEPPSPSLKQRQIQFRECGLVGDVNSKPAHESGASSSILTDLVISGCRVFRNPSERRGRKERRGRQSTAMNTVLCTWWWWKRRHLAPVSAQHRPSIRAIGSSVRRREEEDVGQETLELSAHCLPHCRARRGPATYQARPPSSEKGGNRARTRPWIRRACNPLDDVNKATYAVRGRAVRAKAIRETGHRERLNGYPGNLLLPGWAPTKELERTRRQHLVELELVKVPPRHLLQTPWQPGHRRTSRMSTASRASEGGCTPEEDRGHERGGVMRAFPPGVHVGVTGCTHVGRVQQASSRLKALKSKSVVRKTPCWGDDSTSRTSTRENWYGVAAAALHGRRSRALLVRIALRVKRGGVDLEESIVWKHGGGEPAVKPVHRVSHHTTWSWWETKTPLRHVSPAPAEHRGHRVVGAIPARRRCREQIPVCSAQYVRPRRGNSEDVGEEQPKEGAHWPSTPSEPLNSNRAGNWQGDAMLEVKCTQTSSPVQLGKAGGAGGTPAVVVVSDFWRFGPLSVGFRVGDGGGTHTIKRNQRERQVGDQLFGRVSKPQRLGVPWFKHLKTRVRVQEHRFGEKQGRCKQIQGSPRRVFSGGVVGHWVGTPNSGGSAFLTGPNFAGLHAAPVTKPRPALRLYGM